MRRGAVRGLWALWLMQAPMLWALSAMAQGDGGVAEVTEAELPPEHVPEVSAVLEPKEGIKVGDVARLRITARVPEGDDVTLPEQPFGALELFEKQRHVEPPKDGRKAIVFELHLLAFEAGTVQLDDVRLRVVTDTGLVGEQRLPPVEVPVASHVGNEPNATLKPESKPVAVLEDDYTLAYIGGGLLAVLAVAGLTLLLQRYLRNRKRPEPLPPPPRPPWEIAVEQLADLRRRKQAMIEEGRAVDFVDEVSDVIRAYLGSCFGFQGLDTTTEELLDYLRRAQVASGLQEEARAYLRRCDLVKFAKVEPDQDEVDLIFAKAQDIVQFSMPGPAANRELAEPRLGPVVAQRRP